MDEYHYGERIIFKIVQKEALTTESDAIFNGKELPSKSYKSQLCPFIDNQGLVRARGSLSNADLEFDIIPCTKSLYHLQKTVTRLMMLKYHSNSYHQGVGNMRHRLKQSFGLLGLRDTLRYIKNCFLPCWKHSTVVQAPIIAGES